MKNHTKRCQYSYCYKTFYTTDVDAALCPDCELKQTSQRLEIIQEKQKLALARSQYVKNIALGRNMPFNLVFVGGWFLVGIICAFVNRSDGITGCVYRSIASFLNPGYVVGCELFRERWQIGNSPTAPIRLEK